MKKAPFVVLLALASALTMFTGCETTQSSETKAKPAPTPNPNSRARQKRALMGVLDKTPVPTARWNA